MVNEEMKAKKKVLDSMEYHTKQALKLSKELGVRSVLLSNVGFRFTVDMLGR